MRGFGIIFGLFCSFVAFAYDEKPIVVITASYNNATWYQRNLDSLFSQQYERWRLIYINDCSEDKTGDLVQAYVHMHNQDHRVTLINNKERRLHLANQYDAIHTCAPDEIVLIVDGDDWLMHDRVFAFINDIYSQEDVWLTYGQFWYWLRNKKGICKPLPPDIVAQGRVREFRPWVTSHLRTFYAGLFQRIRYEDLLYKGYFFPMCADVATMFPMIDMAGTHVRFISEILYMYNDANNLSFFHTQRDAQRAIENEIRQRPAYNPLDCLF